MEDHIEEEWPCARGCTWPARDEDEAPRPKPATHGTLCSSCYYRMVHALGAIPDLMANMRLNVTPIRAAVYDSERVQGGGDGSPAPLRVDPLDASDSLFAKLVSWTEVFGGLLRVSQPSVAVWMNLTEVQGSRSVTPQVAHDLASQLVAWFTVRLETIAATDSAMAFHDDIAWGWKDAPGVFPLSGQYGVEPRPLRAADKRECPVCGQREVFVKWPDKLDPDVSVLCGRCKWVAEPEKYDFYARLFG